MAKREETSPRRDGYEKFELSPSSEYFLYGKGSSDDFAREVRRVKGDLKRSLYGVGVAAEEEKKRINGATIVTVVTAILALAMMFFGSLSVFDGVLDVAEGFDAVTVLKEMASVETVAMKTVQIIVAAVLVVTLLIAVLGALMAKKPYVTGATRLLTAVWFLLNVAALIAELADMQSIPVGLMLMLIMSLTSVIAALAGKKKRRE